MLQDTNSTVVETDIAESGETFVSGVSSIGKQLTLKQMTHALTVGNAVISNTGDNISITRPVNFHEALNITGVLNISSDVETTTLLIPNTSHPTYPTVLVFTNGLLTAVDQFTLVMKINTNNIMPNGTGNTGFILPLLQDGTYDFYVAWGDGATQHITNWYNNVHYYTSPGIYTLSLVGTVKGWGQAADPVYTGDRLKPIELIDWSDKFQPYVYDNLYNTFFGCGNLVFSVTTPLNLKNVTSIFQMFGFCQSLTNTAFLTNWDVSTITSFAFMFYGCQNFNSPLNAWNLSSCIDIQAMFFGCYHFNQPLNDWDVSQVIVTNNAFAYASDFNQPLDKWDVRNVQYMEAMFSHATSFKQSLAAWKPYSCTSMNLMFEGSNMNTPGNQDNYNALLLSWGSEPRLSNLQPNVPFHAGSSQYSNRPDVLIARQNLVNKGWIITDGGQV